MGLAGNGKKRQHGGGACGWHGVSALFCAVGILCFVIAAAVFAMWYGDGLGDDVALETRVARADCLVLQPLAGDFGDFPRVRFYAPLAGEWIETRLVSALGRHPRRARPALGFWTRHPPGHTVSCYYDPQDPGLAAALWPHVGSLYGRVAACATVVLVLATVGIMACYAAAAYAVAGGDRKCAVDRDDLEAGATALLL
ncbi:hypothetical protein pkur_cds_515 [Pandoravirus kuranda]|uniref:Uncharacterized protein n=1 Tax=Pandoravirus kuranda TaxID=3019033 RepID=A0AA95EE11_9VIRU|nr:hypothetical protein pkur_cds_515 [Pandoravirus kuranda]